MCVEVSAIEQGIFFALGEGQASDHLRVLTGIKMRTDKVSHQSSQYDRRSFLQTGACAISSASLLNVLEAGGASGKSAVRAVVVDCGVASSLMSDLEASGTEVVACLNAADLQYSRRCARICSSNKAEVLVIAGGSHTKLESKVLDWVDAISSAGVSGIVLQGFGLNRLAQYQTLSEAIHRNQIGCVVNDLMSYTQAAHIVKAYADQLGPIVDCQLQSLGIAINQLQSSAIGNLALASNVRSVGSTWQGRFYSGLRLLSARERKWIADESARSSVSLVQLQGKERNRIACSIYLSIDPRAERECVVTRTLTVNGMNGCLEMQFGADSPICSRLPAARWVPHKSGDWESIDGRMLNPSEVQRASILQAVTAGRENRMPSNDLERIAAASQLWRGMLQGREICQVA